MCLSQKGNSVVTECVVNYFTAPFVAASVMSVFLDLVSVQPDILVEEEARGGTDEYTCVCVCGGGCKVNMGTQVCFPCLKLTFIIHLLELLCPFSSFLCTSTSLTVVSPHLTPPLCSLQFISVRIISMLFSCLSKTV